jgi:hypothetical protein
MRRREKALAPAGFFCNFIGQLPPIVNLFKSTIRGFRIQPVPGPFPFAAFSKKAMGTRLSLLMIYYIPKIKSLQVEN